MERFVPAHQGEAPRPSPGALFARGPAHTAPGQHLVLLYIFLVQLHIFSGRYTRACVFIRSSSCTMTTLDRNLDAFSYPPWNELPGTVRRDEQGPSSARTSHHTRSSTRLCTSSPSSKKRSPWACSATSPMRAVECAPMYAVANGVDVPTVTVATLIL